MSSFADNMAFRDRLKKAAELSGVEWSPTAVARALGYPKQTVHRWFNKGQPKPAEVFRIADKWKVNARYLATEEGEIRAEASQAQTIDSPEVIRLILAFGWLTKDQKKKRLAELEADALTNKTFAREIGIDFEFKSDKEMLDHLIRGGDFPPGKKKPAMPRKGPKFKEEDPE